MRWTCPPNSGWLLGTLRLRAVRAMRVSGWQAYLLHLLLRTSGFDSKDRGRQWNALLAHPAQPMQLHPLRTAHAPPSPAHRTTSWEFSLSGALAPSTRGNKGPDGVRYSVRVMLVVGLNNKERDEVVRGPHHEGGG